MVPYFYYPLCCAGQEDGWNISIPSNIINWSVVSNKCLQKLWTVLSCTFVYQALIRTYQEYCIITRIKRYTSTTIYKRLAYFIIHKIYFLYNFYDIVIMPDYLIIPLSNLVASFSLKLVSCFVKVMFSTSVYHRAVLTIVQLLTLPSPDTE